MDERELEFVVAVAEELNFTRAAKRCHIAQSGLSHRVAQLEREIGATLFERSSRSVRLTPEGHVFLPYARRMLRDSEDVQAELAALRGIVRGRLRIGSIPGSVSGVDLLGLLGDYRKTYPGIDITLSDEGSLSAARAVLAGDLDAAFVGLFANQVPTGLAHQVLTLEPLVALVGRDHPLRGAGTVSLSSLAESNPFLESHPDSGLRTQVDEACERVHARRQVVCELRNPADLASLALEGIGVAVVPQGVAAASVPLSERACVLRLDDARASQPLALIYCDPEPHSHPVQAFLRLASERWPHVRPAPISSR